MVEVLSTTILVAIYPMMSRVYRGDGQDSHLPLHGRKAGVLHAADRAADWAWSSACSPREIIVPLFGAGYSATAAILRVLIWYAVVTMVDNVFAQALYVQNRQRYHGERCASAGWRSSWRSACSCCRASA